MSEKTGREPVADRIMDSEVLRRDFEIKIKGKCEDKMMAENRGCCWLIVFNRRNKNIQVEKREKDNSQEVLGKSKVRKSKEDKLYPDEEAISAGEAAVK